MSENPCTGGISCFGNKEYAQDGLSRSLWQHNLHLSVLCKAFPTQRTISGTVRSTLEVRRPFRAEGYLKQSSGCDVQDTSRYLRGVSALHFPYMFALAAAIRLNSAPHFNQQAHERKRPVNQPR